jgi:lysine 2,3-aminomutase
MILSDEELNNVCQWLDQNREVTDILLSGGDIMTLPDETVISITKKIRNAGNVETVRICSRAPAAAPERITDSIAKQLADIEGLWFVTHFNHPDELTAEAKEACRKLVRNGIPVLNQTVLLAGINDDAETMRILFKTLASWRVKPHYLFHVDPIEGVAHFATGVRKGIEILKDFQTSLSSLATPAFAIDLPCGGGKLNLTAAEKNENGEWFSPVLKRYIKHPLTEL